MRGIFKYENQHRSKNTAAEKDRMDHVEQGVPMGPTMHLVSLNGLLLTISTYNNVHCYDVAFAMFNPLFRSTAILGSNDCPLNNQVHIPMLCDCANTDDCRTFQIIQPFVKIGIAATIYQLALSCRKIPIGYHNPPAPPLLPDVSLTVGLR